MKRFFTFFVVLGLTWLSLVTPAQGMDAGSSSDALPSLLCTDEDPLTLPTPRKNSFKRWSATTAAAALRELEATGYTFAPIVRAKEEGEGQEETEKENVAKKIRAEEEQLRELASAEETARRHTKYHNELTLLQETIIARTSPQLEKKLEKPHAVILDVDETTLLTPKMLQFIETAAVPPSFDELPAIPAIHDLHDFFVEQGCIIIFLTARNENYLKTTMTNLIMAGYRVNKIICAPAKIYEHMTMCSDLRSHDLACKVTANWKKAEIGKLMALYNIVAFMDDSADNIAAAEALLPGRCFKVPRPDEV